MGPLRVRLAAWGSAGKALGEVASGQRPFDTPAGRNRGQRLEHEAAPCDLRMRDSEAARSEAAAAPGDEIEVQDARSPALARPAAELAFDPFQALQHLARVAFAFDERDRVGEIAAGSAVRRIEHDRRGIEQAEVLVEPGNRRLDDAGWSAKAAVRTVRPDPNGVEVRCVLHRCSPRSGRWASPPPQNDRRFPKRKRRATALYALGWWRFARNAGSNSRPGGT